MDRGLCIRVGKHKCLPKDFLFLFLLSKSTYFSIDYIDIYLCLGHIYVRFLERIALFFFNCWVVFSFHGDELNLYREKKNQFCGIHIAI